MATPAQPSPWRWLVTALLVASLIVNLRNPDRGIRLVSWFELLPGIIILVNYGLYADYRRRRSRHDSQNDT